MQSGLVSTHRYLTPGGVPVLGEFTPWGLLGSAHCVIRRPSLMLMCGRGCKCVCDGGCHRM
eukprot:scaffold11157_cov69-Phaeocystis_antarctica.AAC.7